MRPLEICTDEEQIKRTKTSIYYNEQLRCCANCKYVSVIDGIDVCIGFKYIFPVKAHTSECNRHQY